MSNVDATKIHQGPGKLWLAVTVPTNGNRLLINSAGEPTVGTPVFAGATEGAATVVLLRKSRRDDGFALLITIYSLVVSQQREVGSHGHPFYQGDSPPCLAPEQIFYVWRPFSLTLVPHSAPRPPPVE